MTFGFFTRPRSRKRCLIISVMVLMLWVYSPAGITLPVVDLLTRPSLYSQMLDHFQKPLCPSFNKYDRQKLSLLEPNECTLIKSQHPDFSGLCKEANLKYPISENATHDAFHRQFSGPDSFYVVFSGAEKLSPPDWYHAGQCLYVFPFHISNPGKLSLDIMHLYDNFGAVVEQDEGWPSLKRRKVVSNLPLEICRGCPSRIAQPRYPTPSKENDPISDPDATNNPSSLKNRYVALSADKARSDSQSKGSVLPLCSKEMAVQGAWLPAHPLDKNSWHRANYTWVPLGCTFGKPLDRSCLLRKKGALKILFQGDSHLRVALEQLLRRLNRTSDIESTTNSANRIDEKVGSTTLTYIHDPLFTKMREKSDMLVANMGHWATGTKFLDQLWSTAKYHDQLRDLVEKIQQGARDMQDLDDEDFYSANRFLGSDHGNESDDGNGHDDENDDEDEVEMEKQILRQEKQSAKKAGNIEVTWDDETEEEEEEDEIEVRPKPRPSSEEQGMKDHSDDLENKYRVLDRMGPEVEGYQSKGRYMDSANRIRPRPRYPSNRILRQSKHWHSSEPLSDEQKFHEIDSTNTEDEAEVRGSEARLRHSYATQKKVVVGDGSELINSVDRGKKGGVVRGQERGDQDLSNKKPMGDMKLASTKPNSTKTSRLQSNDDSKSKSKNKVHMDENNSSTRYRVARRSHNDRDVDQHSQESPLKMAWVGMVAFPETQASDLHFSHDWRTIYRLRYWNQIAEDVMLLHKVRFMDFFSLTLSMLDTSPDRGHFFGTDAAEAMLEELSFKLGLCEEDEEQKDL
ncbi:hypothetical protein BGZ51_007579 [Haplosporangium sp. Z 767]|nr:hypothetical protein BGZ51_007579 [Haplosporangium sp. Z 767]KAF9191705.1 hypothetical protein BGZ50_009178 [Haplosporangium sp. Z 11]